MGVVGDYLEISLEVKMKLSSKRINMMIWCYAFATLVMNAHLVIASEPSFDFYFDWTGGFSYKDFNSTNCFEACLLDPKCMAYSSRKSDNSDPYGGHSEAVSICSLLSEISRVKKRIYVTDSIEPVYLTVYQKTSPFTMSHGFSWCKLPLTATC